MESNNNIRPTDHLANERTFLAWMRTSVAIMTFGFVVVKFSLFVKQITMLLGDGVHQLPLPAKGYSAILGIVLVALGTIMAWLAYVRFRRTEKQLTENKYIPSSTLSMLFTLAIILVGILLVLYLIPSV